MLDGLYKQSKTNSTGMPIIVFCKICFYIIKKLKH